MALSPYKIYVAGEILTASDLNASFAQITSNALQLISPLTGTLDVDGKTIILDADADSNLAAGTDDVLNLTLQSFLAFIFDGNVASPVNGITLEATATGVGPMISAHGETNVDLRLKGKGTGMVRLLTENSLSLDVSEPLATRVLIKPGGATDVGLAIQAAGTGVVRIGDALISFPETDGLPGQALVTNGSGDLGWDYGVPVGTIIAYAGTSAPTGYLDCDGANVSRATYSALFSAIGTTWGVGDGVTTFGVPDLRRRTMVGSGGVASAGPANTVGSTGGNETVNIAHTHSFTPAGTLDTVDSGPTAAAGGAAFTVVSNGHSHTFTGSGGTTGSGGSTGLNMFQPSAVVKFAIKH
jgi:microcystin-dependent protein